MNKKVLLSILLIGVLAFSAGMGTFAYFTKTFTSSNNVVTAATFDVDTGGNFTGSRDFIIDKLAPGLQGKWDVKVNKKNSDVKVGHYTIKINGEKYSENQDYNNYLLRNNTPIKFDLYEHTDGEYKLVKKSMEFDKEYTISSSVRNSDWFRIEFRWPFGTAKGNDNEFQGDKAKVDVTLVAHQGIEENVKYANLHVEDRGENKVSTATVRIKVDENNKLIELSGYDNLLGELVFDGQNLNGVNGVNLTPNVNGYYLFDNYDYNDGLKIEIQP